MWGCTHTQAIDIINIRRHHTLLLDFPLLRPWEEGQGSYLLVTRQVMDSGWWGVVQHQPLELQQVEQRLKVQEGLRHVSNIQ